MHSFLDGAEDVDPSAGTEPKDGGNSTRVVLPRPSDPQTCDQEALEEWSGLVARARAATVPRTPSYPQAVSGNRDALFRDLGYTFWNEELLDALAARCQREGPVRWVELAAGTGYLTAALATRGVEIAATDDYSQTADRVRGAQRAIRYGGWVACLDAREAVRRLSPEAVICAWPPLGSCLVPDLLAEAMAGATRLRLVLCIGEPGGATEAPVFPHEVPEGWLLEAWPDCERYLVGFNDPGDGARCNSRLLVYRRR